MLAAPIEEILKQAISIIGRNGVSDDEIEDEILTLVRDRMVARRLIDWVPEVFGIVLVSHLGNIILPRTFSARNKRGDWVEFKFEAEPIVQAVAGLAVEMYHGGPRDVFGNIALRSSSADAANRALNAGDALDGASLSGPALIGVPAETYLPPVQPFWRRLFRN